jgi:TonB-linked SusC/RagA family outer membrane protein
MRKFTLFLALLFFIGLQGVLAQTRSVTGKVTSSEDKSPIPGVTVVVKGTTIGTTTNPDGTYELTFPAKYDVLEYSYVGLKTQDITVGTSNTYDVVMEPDILNVSGIVVTAIGIPRETRALSYSVQEVGSQDLSKSAHTDVINALQGKVSDVQVIKSAGVAGAASYITIRGVQSITQDNQPLFVVDGVPVDNSGGQYGVDGVATSNRGLDINPDDIASVNVLKGGAATALYGIRAASGAIIITTKKGKADISKKIAVNFSTSVTLDYVSQLPKRQNQYSQGSDSVWASGNPFSWGARLDTCSYNPTLVGTGPSTWNYWPGFDVDGAIVSQTNPNASGMPIHTYNPYDFFQTGVTTDNSLALSGGNETSSFYFSMSDSKSKGIVPNNDFRRNTFRFSTQTKLSDKVKMSGNVNYIITTGSRIQQGSNISGVMLGLLRTPPTFDNAAGYINTNPLVSYLQRSYRHGSGYDNPYWTANMNHYRDKVNRLIGDFTLDYIATKWLSFTYRVGVDYWGRSYKDELAVGSRTQPAGWTHEGYETNKDFNSDLIMTIDKNFGKDFNLHLILGNNMSQLFFNAAYPFANDVIIPDFYNLINTSTISANEATTQIRRAGYYGDLELSWKNMVYLSLTGRNDWSTTLPEGKNSFFYPSVGAGFIFTELPGLQDNTILPYGKLRVSYAIVAKDADVYRTKTYYGQPVIADGWTFGETWPFGGVSGYGWGVFVQNQVAFSQLGNNVLKPEKTKSFEIGADLKFYQNRVGLSYTYFVNKGEDLLLDVPIAASTGFLQITLNAGSMRTRGHEVTLYFTPVKTKDWQWDFTVNWSRIRNEVLKLAPGIENVVLGLFSFTDPQIRAVAGQPYRTIYSYGWQHDPNGNILIDDSGFPIDDSIARPLKNVDPDWTMGASTTLRWKDLSLYVLFDIKSGGYMWNGTRGAMDYFGTSEGTANRDELYTFQGVVASTGLPNDKEVHLDQNWRQGLGSGFTGPSVDYIEKSSWVRMRTITLSYSLTRYLTKTFIKGLDIYLTGTNLFLSTPYTGVDPETNLFGNSNSQGIDYFNMPGTKSYTLGLSLAF